MTIHASTHRTPVGPLSILVEEAGICAAGFTPRSEELHARLSPLRRRSKLQKLGDLGDVSAAVAAYFAGEVGALDGLDVAQEGSPYHHRVCAALREIPAGRTVTYRELAMRMGSITAARAVGTACGRNLIAPIVPCHRAVRTDGGLGGYYWGLDRKRWLLRHERTHAVT
jgi:methylated-DNA-[protein]-cysteine S-methyltransferase